MGFLTVGSWSFLDPFILIVSLICSWVFCHRIYNRYFHPLAHIPGPEFGRMSPWPSVLHALKGDRHLWIDHCFKKYGNKIRIEPNTVLFRSPTALHTIYGSKANVKRAKFYDALVRREEDRTTISTIDNAAHAKRRKLLNQAFTEKSLRAAAVFMERHIDRWNELLLSEGGEDWSAPLNFADWSDRLVFDILGDVAFGRSFQIKEPGENTIRGVPHAIVKTMRFLYPITKTPLITAIPWLRPRGLSKLFDRIRSKETRLYDAFADSSVSERLEREKAQDGESREDMMHFLCKAKDPDTGLRAFTDKDINNEARLLLVAGSDSTTVTMSGLFFYLGHYPDVHAKLTKEVTSTFATADEITPGAKLSSCKYLRACIDEAMRKAPAGLSELPREVLAGGMVIDDEYIHEGVVVGTSRYSDNNNEEVFGDPEVFRPERWIPGDGNFPEEVSRIRANFYPFSIGPFNCIGTNFALQELMLMVAKTVYRLDFRLAPGTKKGNGAPEMDLKDAYITVKNGPVLQFRRRAQ